MSQIFWFLYVYTTYVSQLRKFRVNIFTVMLTSWKITKFLLCPLGTIYKQLISYCLQVRRVEKNLCGLNSQRRSLRKWLLTSISSLATKKDTDNIAILLQIMCQAIH